MARAEPPLLLVATLLTAVLVFGEVASPLRSGVALVWMAMCPGLALCRMCGLGPRAQLLLAVPTSLALSALVSGVLVYANAYSWQLGFTILVSLVVGAVTLSLAPLRVTSHLPLSRANMTGKLADEQRQAMLLQSLQAGATLNQAAEAAGISVGTLRKRLRSSEILRRAVELSSAGRVVDGGRDSSP